MNQLDEGVIWDKFWNKTSDIQHHSDPETSDDLWSKIHFQKIDEIVSQMQKNSVFLEAGCGLGQWCFYATKRYGVKSVGVDIAKNTLERLNQFVKIKSLENISFIEDDLNNTNLSPEICDFFVSLGVIEHFKDSNPMLRSLHKILKKGGLGLITVPNIYSMHTFTRPIAKLTGHWDVGYEKSFSPRGLRKSCENCGFTIKEVGTLPSGQFFGMQLNLIFPRLRDFSFWLEKSQNTFGWISYVIVSK